MGRVLRLDISGTPTSWLSRQEAAVLYVKNLVQWEIGNKSLSIFGGINRLTGQQSSLDISPVIATKGCMHRRRLASNFNNRMLFRRDNNRCMYCGTQHYQSGLTRDHVVPRAHGGKDIWENVVAACGRCNHFKADRTPEEDQMEYLEKQFSTHRKWIN